MGMGERKLRAKAFKQQTDKAMDEEIHGNLLTNQYVQEEVSFECIRDPEDSKVEVNDAARLIDMRHRIDVYIGMRPVGHVVDEQIHTFRNICGTDKNLTRSVSGRIVDVSELSPTFIVSVSPE